MLHLRPTKLDEGIWSLHALNLCPIQAPKLSSQLLKIPERQLLGIPNKREEEEGF
jgi:hypothetical protein